ncbi:MAG: NTE family protein [Parcubacteria group bacterium Gr01-1014_66]|nr:MAG: NTE family protein [Parcubacteria group bacterium Gr01-1014_66]
MPSGTHKKIDAVFEGGGVKGSGLVGAISVVERLGYRFENVAGTSAGAIVASLIAVGYTARELKALMDEIDYRTFKDRGTLGHIPLVGLLAQLAIKKGIYEGNFFEDWIRGLLLQKGIKTFGDLWKPEYKDDPVFCCRLQVVVSDISRGRLIVLPRDSIEYGIDPQKLDIARAVRMSMSIPFFYKPIKMRTREGVNSYLVDGGILSNFPIWLLDDGSDDPEWPTIGFKLVEPEEGTPHRIFGPVTLFAALFSTMMEAHDARYIKDVNFMRTIPIPTLGVQTTDFHLSQERREALYTSGVRAAEDFFGRWDFEAFKQMQREVTEVRRRETVWKKGTV